MITLLVMNEEFEQIDELWLTNTAPNVDKPESAQQFADIVRDYLGMAYEITEVKQDAPPAL